MIVEKKAPGKVLLTEEQITERVGEMGRQIRRDFYDKNPIVLCVTKGAVFFFVDLLRAIGLPVEIGFIEIASYGERTTSSSNPIIHLSPELDLRDRHVILVEDITDSCRSMAAARYLIYQEREAASVAVATFLDKPTAHQVEFRADYIGFEIPPLFVVGYGLDFGQRYRTLRTVNALPSFAGVVDAVRRDSEAKKCLILAGGVDEDEVDDLLSVAEDFGALAGVVDGMSYFLVALDRNSPQQVISETELRQLLSQLWDTRC